MDSQDKQPRRRSILSRLRRYLNGPVAGIPTRPLHPALAGHEMRAKIRKPLESYLVARGFSKAEEQWEWTRPRTPWVDDYVFAPLLIKSAPELYGISLHVGLVCAPVNRLFAELSGGRYRLPRPLLSPLISDPSLTKNRVPSRWDFWSTSFDDEGIDDMLWHLEHYGFPFMEAFSTLEDLVLAVVRYATLFQQWPEKAAAILAFAGRFAEAQQRLEDGLRTVKGMSEEQTEIISAMTDALRDRTLPGLIAELRREAER